MEGKPTQITIFLCGDVMLGRGIDQVLPHPGSPVLHEPFVKNAVRYVELAETATGPIPRPVGFDYVWGDALSELSRIAPDARVVNLETSITTSSSWKDKEVHYRMNPANVPCITAAGIDCCALANNHILDWGYTGLAETLDSLSKAKVKAAGAGMDLAEAERPAMIQVPGRGRVLVFSLGSTDSGIPADWAAAEDRPGVNLLEDYSDGRVRHIAASVKRAKTANDVVVASIHWGGNWGYNIPERQVEFAHKLIERGDVDIIHGHSSHHVRGIEVYRGKPVLYGSGDFLNDYEGITGHESFRGDLGLMYFLTVNTQTGQLSALRMIPTQVKHFRVNRASSADAMWLAGVMSREGTRLGTSVGRDEENMLTLNW